MLRSNAARTIGYSVAVRSPLSFSGLHERERASNADDDVDERISELTARLCSEAEAREQGSLQTGLSLLNRSFALATSLILQ